MKENKNSNSFLSTKTIAALVTTILALGSITAWYAYNNLEVKNQDNKPTETIPNPDNNSNNNQQKIEIYGLNEELKIIPNTVDINIDKTENPQESLTIAFNTLLTGFNSNNLTSAIPENTKLMSLTVKEDGIHIDLSSEFTTGGGSASMIGRLGQIVYTASSLNPNVNVWINVDGKPLDILGEEGLMVEQPMTRDIFIVSFPN